jgi:hypothetical protein
MTTAPPTGTRLRLPRVTSARKKRAVFLLMVVLSVWPLAHHWMATTWDMDPWRFFGFSMYAVPKSRVALVTFGFGVDPDVPTPELTDDQRRAFMQLAGDLRGGRQALGTLYPWRSTFRRMFDLLPEEIGTISIVLGKSYLDEEAMLRIRRLEMECRRLPDDDGDGDALHCTRNE